MKLFISGAVFDHAERHKKIDMNTSILHNGTISGDRLQGSVYPAGKGNALLSTKDLKKVADAMRRSGIKRITGDVVADDTLFAKGIERVKSGPAYAPASALGLDLHTVAVTEIDYSGTRGSNQ